MKILVTGGAGFMGSNFIRYVLKKYPDYQIVNLDKLTYAGNLKNLAEVESHPNYKFIKGDIAEKDDVQTAVQGGVEAIVNYAAETHNDRSIMEPETFLRTDIFGTFNLLEAVRGENIPRLVQISTDEVFGMVHDKKTEFSEESRFDPSSPYSASKAGGDLMCSAYWKTYQTPVIVTHSCNFYGPNQYPEKLIPLFVTNLLEGKKIPIYGKGDQFREWIFTEEHCKAIDLILHKGKIGEIYNIGTRDRRTNIDITKFLLDYFKKGEDQIEFVKDRPGHDFGYAINPDKLMNELQWKPEVKLEEGLKLTADWYKKNEKWWRNVKNGDFDKYYEKQYG